MQILPSIGLRPFIKHYLILESEQKAVKKLRLFSDGNPGMVFSLKSDLIFTIEHNKQSDYLPESFVYGQINDFKDLYFMNEAALIIVVFQPAGLNQLMRIAAGELSDTIIKTGDLFGWRGLVLQEKLSGQNDLADKVEMINTFFIEWAARSVRQNNPLVAESVNFIFKNNGTNSIRQLVKHTGYTERHIERSFMECIGLSPKRFGNIVKLHSFLKLLKNKSRQNTFTRMSYEAGYADQSHLIKEFKKYTGITPNDYLHKTNRLTTNLMEFNSPRTTTDAMSGLYNFRGNP